MQRAEIIAEIGINHDGDIKKALELVKTANLCGADVVKFQKREPELAVPRHMWESEKETPWGDVMSYIDYKKAIEFSYDEYVAIDSLCWELSICWTASVWDVPSAMFIIQNFPHVPFIKIPSAKLTDTELLGTVSSSGKPIYLSTGMSYIEEIDTAVELLGNLGTELSLLHCHSAYPADMDEINLSQIAALRDRYGHDIPVGYSNHTVSPLPCIVAAALGASIIEAHITLHREDRGTDHASSLEPKGFQLMSREITKLPEYWGGFPKTVLESEKPYRDKLR